MQDNELFKKKRRPFSPETVDSRRKRAPLLITWHYSTGQGQCQMKISAKGREVLLRPSHPLGPKTEGWLVYAKAGGQIGVCRVNKLTIDNEQLTIMVSLRDELKLFLNYFRRKFLNCQLSIVNSTTPGSSPSIARQSRVSGWKTRDCRAFYFSASGKPKAAAGGWGRPA